MFSAVKFVVASVIVALFGGFLLAGILTTQQGDEIVPAAVTESPTPMTTDASLFPTGTFVAAEWSDRVLEFNDDGTCRYSSHDDPWHANCTYEVVGDLFTEASYEWGSPDYEHQPATYRWQFDGEYLTFELVGDDGNSWRRAFYQEQPYRYVPDPRVAVIASFDIEPGTRLLAGHTELRVVSAADIPADTLTTKDPATDAITTVAITKGQPITSDMLAQPTD